MKRTQPRGGLSALLGGYTLIEVLIFLAVSGALLFSAAALISGKQERTRFTQSVVSLEEQFQDTFNDVSTGYFPSNGDFSCRNSGSDASPNIQISSVSGTGQGSNKDCIFVGKMIHFYVGTQDKYRVYTMVGLKDATSLTSKPIELLGGSSGNVGIADDKTTEAGLLLQRFGSRYGVIDTTTGRAYHTIAIVSDFGSTAGANNSVTGNAGRVKLYGVNANPSTGGTKIDTSLFYEITNSVAVCLQQDTGGRKAALIITKQLTIERQIDSWPGACA